MDFKTAVRTCLKDKLLTITGRASRSEYWYFQLLVFVIYFIGSAVSKAVPLLAILFLIVYLLLLVPSVTAGVRRLHDTNKSGWFMLLGIIPLVNLVLVYFLVVKSDEGSNKYGTLES